jgi:hypothetical protein
MAGMRWPEDVVATGAAGCAGTERTGELTNGFLKRYFRNAVGAAAGSDSCSHSTRLVIDAATAILAPALALQLVSDLCHLLSSMCVVTRSPRLAD